MSTTHTPTAYDPRRGAAVVAAAMAEWKAGVREPPHGDPSRIREYLRACGFARPEEYDSDGDAEWCGAFAAFCLIASGVRPELVRQKSPPEAGGLGSTYRLFCLAQAVPGRLITLASDLRPGDVVSVGRPGKVKWGEHIVLCAEKPTPFDEASTFATIEGNATGAGPGGIRYEGVVRRTRPVMPTANAKGFVFGLRPLPGDYIGEMHHE